MIEIKKDQQPLLYSVVIETKVPVPEWFKNRLFSKPEDALLWARQCGAHMLMPIGDETKTVSSFSDGQLTIKVKPVIIDEECPKDYQTILEQIKS